MNPASRLPPYASRDSRVRILGIHGADDYLRLAGYLDGLSIVRRVAPASATPDALELDLELASGIANFARYVGRGSVLSPVSGTDGETGPPFTFRLVGS